MGGSLIKWIFQPKSISTSLEKNTVYQYFFFPWEAGLQGAVYQVQKSSIMVSLDSDGASQLRLELQFLSQPVARIVSDVNNRIQFLRSEWNNKVLVYVS